MSAARPKAETPAIRPATLADVPALVELENRIFAGDRLSPRSFRHLIAHGHAAVLVEEREGQIRGLAVLFFRRGSRASRLYSFAVAPEHRGRGLAKALLEAAERAAGAHGCTALRLEVHKENHQAQAVYRKAGYHAFASYPAYYHDGGTALRMEKRLEGGRAGA